MSHLHRAVRQSILFCLLLCLTGCKKSESVATRLDCQEDLDCYITRARDCLPTTVAHTARYPLNQAEPASTVLMTLQYEIHGWVRGRCHVSRSQLRPAWDWPDAGPMPEEGMEQDIWRERQEMPFNNTLGLHAPLMQCLYSGAETARVMERVRDGTSMLQDLEPCYPGDGRCGVFPNIAVECATRECLLGRWSLVCGQGKQLLTCEGTRLSDNTPREQYCVSTCDAEGHEVLDCDTLWPERRRAKLRREAETRRSAALDAGLLP